VAVKVVSFINLKGGVGKTTLALAIGEFLAFRDHRKVLLIDLDAQSNLSYALVSRLTLERLGNEKKTVYHMFRAALDGQPWDIKTAITNDCSNINRIEEYRKVQWRDEHTRRIVKVYVPGRRNECLSVLVCLPDLGQLDEEILNMLERRESIKVDFRRILKEHLATIREEFDWIIIDCPPSLSTLTSNAIIASDYFVAPVAPEFLSLEGLDLILNRIGQLKGRLPYGDEITVEFAGCILNKVDITRRRDHLPRCEEIFDSNASFHQPFHWWVGNLKPLYTVTDYSYPFNRGKRSDAWRHIVEKYTYYSRNPRNPLGTVLQRGDKDSYSIFERLSNLTDEFVERCS